MVSQQGAPRRAFFSYVGGGLPVALLLSVVLHATLLSLRLPPVQEPPNARPEIQVRFNGSAPAHVVAKSPELRHEAGRRVVTNSSQQPATPVLPAAAPAVTGLAIPQQLPIPFPGKRPLWSFETAQTAGAQAAYQAQAQRRANLAMLAQARNARAQYEAQLTLRLRDVGLTAACRIVVPGHGRASVRCTEPADGDRVSAVLQDLGSPPEIDMADSLEVMLSPGTAGQGPSVTQRRVVRDPEH